MVPENKQNRRYKQFNFKKLAKRAPFMMLFRRGKKSTVLP
jgi:hypothetical protein